MDKANKREQEEHARAKRNASGSEPALDSTSDGDGTKKAKEFKVGCSVFRTARSVARAGNQIVR
jgi:hypothetical protein